MRPDSRLMGIWFLTLRGSGRIGFGPHSFQARSMCHRSRSARFLFRVFSHAGSAGHVFVANQMDQPGQINRTFFRRCFGVCEGLFTLADPVKNVVGWIRTRLNREFGRLQRIIDVVPFGVVVRALPSANFIGPGTRTHEDEGGEIEVGAFRRKRLLPFSVIRMGFQDLGHLLLENLWKLTICLCCDDLVTCAAPGFSVGVEKQRRGDAKDGRQFVRWGSRILLGAGSAIKDKSPSPILEILAYTVQSNGIRPTNVRKQNRGMPAAFKEAGCPIKKNRINCILGWFCHCWNDLRICARSHFV